MKEISISEALERIYPKSTALIISVDNKGNPNAMAANWHMRTSFSPPLYAVSIGKTRYTHDLVKGSREFVIGFPSERIKNQVMHCGTHSGRDGDKIKTAGLNTLEPKIVKTPLIDDCVVCLECRLRDEIETGDHTIFVGEVVAAHVAEGKILFNFSGGELKEL